MTFEGEVVSVHIASVGGEPMMEVAQAQAVVGSGLAGDRYAEGVGTYSKIQGPHREVTLIEIEAVEALARDHDIHLDAGQSRRNIVTRGAPLNHLVGAEFSVGDVRMRGVRLNEPCKYFENLLGIEGLHDALINRSGLNAQVLSEGSIRAGDVIKRI
ncbi:MAG: MOSC domain-containing protein [Nitrospinae bacterium]|nr:MOSC domain-containing protein [Nitrospinota bacterium]